MMKRAILSLALLLTPLPASADWILLGSWNIEHLGRLTQEDTGPKPLAEAIHLAGLDILVMQEIYDNDASSTTRTNSQLTGAVEVLNRIPGNNWTYRLLANRFEDDTRQLIAYAWNRSRVEQVGAPYRIPIIRNNTEWHRHPHALKFTAGAMKTDIVVVPLHMKADYRGDFSTQRAAEARLLADQLPSVRSHFDDNDIVLIGDLNCDEANEPALQVFAGAGLRDLNEEDTATHVRYGPLDRILVPSEDEFRYSRQYILTAADSDTFDAYLSDHQIVLVPIRILRDDD